MLAGGKYRSIIASTLAEIRGALPLVKEGILDEVYIPQHRTRALSQLNVDSSAFTAFPSTQAFCPGLRSYESHCASS